jgi:hypothetical protein
MTETSILPGAEPATGEGADMTPPGIGAEETDGRDRRRLLIIGAIVGAIVLAAAAYLLLHKGSSSPAPLVAPAAAGPASVTTPSKAPKPGKNSGNPKTLPKKANRPDVRDPFNPLVVAPVTTGGAPASTTTVKAPSAGSGTAPTSTTPVTTPTSPSSTTPGTGKSTSGGPLWIELMRVHGRSALFDVGYAHHSFRKFVVQAPTPSSSQGTVFDKVFALIGVQDGEATLQIGDATPFDLAKGISHTV